MSILLSQAISFTSSPYYSEHLDSHIKPYRCNDAPCKNKPFSSPSNFSRHTRELRNSGSSGAGNILKTPEVSSIPLSASRLFSSAIFWPLVVAGLLWYQKVVSGQVDRARKNCQNMKANAGLTSKPSLRIWCNGALLQVMDCTHAGYDMHCPKHYDSYLQDPILSRRTRASASLCHIESRASTLLHCALRYYCMH